MAAGLRTNRSACRSRIATSCEAVAEAKRARPFLSCCAARACSARQRHRAGCAAITAFALLWLSTRKRTRYARPDFVDFDPKLLSVMKYGFRTTRTLGPVLFHTGPP